VANPTFLLSLVPHLENEVVWTRYETRFSGGRGWCFFLQLRIPCRILFWNMVLLLKMNLTTLGRNLSPSLYYIVTFPVMIVICLPTSQDQDGSLDPGWERGSEERRARRKGALGSTSPYIPIRLPFPKATSIMHRLASG
jgi:hypothetical protein